MSKILFLIVFSFLAFAQGPANTVVVYSSTSSASSTLANYYKTARSIPNANMCSITPPDDTSNQITQTQYQTAIRDPIKTCITNVGRASVYYVVMVWIRNLRFTGDNGETYSIDSFLQDPWDTVSTNFPIHTAPYNLVTNGYYNAALNTSAAPPYQWFVPLANYRAANPTIHLFSVWRIDGDTTALAQGLIDKAIAAEAAGGPSGKICADGRGVYGDVTGGLAYTDGGYTMVEYDTYRLETLANNYLPAASFPLLANRVEDEFGQNGQPSCTGAAFFGGWYGGAGSHFGTYSWVTGAIGIHVDSYSLGDFRTPFNGQSPAGTWGYQELKNGLTVTSGSVGEQYVAGSTRSSGVLWDLLQGANVGDAFLRNTWLASRWQLVLVGDPLYTPWRGGRYVPKQSRHSRRGLSAGRGIIGIR